MASEETNGLYVDRTEATLNSPQPCQLTIKRSSGSNTFVRSTESKSSSETQKAEINVEIQGVNEVSVTELKGSASSETQRAEVSVERQGFTEVSLTDSDKSSESQTAEVSGEIQGLKETELHRSISSESQRSEVKVEIQGFRETSLSTSDNIITTRVRTVYSRSSSGSTSGADFDPAIISLQLGSDSAFGPDSSDAPATSPDRERKMSDSYYISQTYQISSPEKSSLSVSAVQNVRFKSSKDIEICGHGKAGGDQDPHFVDRFEEVISGEDPNTLGSPKDKLSTFAWYGSMEDRSHDLEKLKTTRENVQQLIQSSYLVDDITSVVDRDGMGPDALKPAEDSLTLLSLETKKTSSLNNPSSYDFRFIYDTYAARPEDLPLCQPSDTLKSDKETPARLTYSPGIAIRSYALEELTEKKSRSTPDRVQAAVKSSRFDEDSSQVDIDSGSSVDELPHLSKVDFSHLKSKHSETRSSTTQEIHMFKLTKVQKVTLSDEPHPIPTVLKPAVSQYTSVQEENKEEDDELLDKLVDLDSIQVGYRFHDVGMMQEAGGICNLAFDDSDETDAPDTSKTFSSQELSSSYLPGGQAATVTSLGSGSAASSILSSPVNSYISASEQSSQIKYGVQETTTTTKMPEDQSSVSAGPAFVSTQLNSDAVDKSSEISSKLSTLQVDAQSTVSVVDAQTLHANAGTRNNISTESEETIHIDNDSHSITIDKVSKVKTVENSLNGNLSSEVVSKTQTSETKTLVIDSKTSTQSLVSGSAMTETAGRTTELDSKTTSIEVSSVSTDAVVDSKRVDTKLVAAEPVTVDVTGESDVSAADSKKTTGKANSKHKKSAKSKNKGSVLDTHAGTKETVTKETVTKEAASKEAVSKETVSKETVFKEAVSKETVTKEAINVDKDLKSVSITAKSDAQKVTSDTHAKNAEDKMQNAANIKSAKKHKKKKNKGKKSENATKNAELSDDNGHTNSVEGAAGDHLVGSDDVALTKNVEVVQVEVHAARSAPQSVGQQGSVSMLREKNQPADGVDSGDSVEHVVATALSAESKLTLDAHAASHTTLDSVNLTKFGQAENKILSQSSEDEHSISVTNSKTQTLQVESVAMTTLKQESKVSSVESVARSVQAESRDRVLNSVSPSSLEVTRAGCHGVSSNETQALVMETPKGNLSIDSKTTQSKTTLTTGLTSKTPTKPLPRVPVTRTFNVGKKFEPALKSLGAILKSETLSVDVYFDTPEFELTLSDCWLRSHNGRWQLHANFTKLLNETTKLEYSEHEDLETIKSLLSKILKKKLVADGSTSMASCVCQLGLKEFVRYRTTKKVYSCGDMTIELNLPEYGFWTGQVTALAPSKLRIQDAVNNIFDLWAKTGADALNLLVE